MRELHACRRLGLGTKDLSILQRFDEHDTILVNIYCSGRRDMLNCYTEVLLTVRLHQQCCIYHFT